MSNERKYILDGYRFETEADYLLAKKEMDRLFEIKEKNDLRDVKKLREIYDALLERGDLKTPIGIGFLREVQRELLKNPEQKKTMRAIPVIRLEAGSEENKAGKGSLPDYKALFSVQRIKIRNLRIILCFLTVIILVLFAVTVFDRSLTPEKAREAVLNEYASWKEELTSKEDELRAREKLVKEKEELLNQDNETDVGTKKE